MIWLRSAVFNLLLFGLTALWMVVVGLPLLLAPERTALKAGGAYCRLLMRLLAVVAGLRFELRGDPGLLAGARLVAAKHQSAWDTFIFYVIAEAPAYVMKQELFRIPIYGWLARHQGMIGIDRAAGAKGMVHMLGEVGHALAAGRQVILFPQGTRVAPGASRPYLPGVAALYLKLRRPVVPVALNSGLYWGRRSFLKRPGRIIVEILPEIPPGLDRKAFMAELEQRLEEGTRRLEAEAQTSR